MPDEQNINWEAIAKAWMHPTQVKILEELARRRSEGQRAVSPVQLVELLGDPKRSKAKQLGTLSYHMRILVRMKLARLTRTRPRRGALQHFYVIHPRAFSARAVRAKEKPSRLKAVA